MRARSTWNDRASPAAIGSQSSCERMESPPKPLFVPIVPYVLPSEATGYGVALDAVSLTTVPAFKPDGQAFQGAAANGEKGVTCGVPSRDGFWMHSGPEPVVPPAPPVPAASAR